MSSSRSSRLAITVTFTLGTTTSNSNTSLSRRGEERAANDVALSPQRYQNGSIGSSERSGTGTNPSTGARGTYSTQSRLRYGQPAANHIARVMG